MKIASIGRIIDVGETIEWDDVGEWDDFASFIEGKVECIFIYSESLRARLQ